MNGVKIVQPGEGYLPWVCFLARLIEPSSSVVVLRVDNPGDPRGYSDVRADVLLDSRYSDVQKLKVLGGRQL